MQQDYIIIIREICCKASVYMCFSLYLFLLTGISVSPPPPAPLPSDSVKYKTERKCIKDYGECITLQSFDDKNSEKDNYHECDGRCLDKGTPCIGNF